MLMAFPIGIVPNWCIAILHTIAMTFDFKQDVNRYINFALNLPMS